MTDAAFPHLGWDPAPGSPAEIAALRSKLTSSATALGTAHRLVQQLLGESSYWKGEAADAFREALDGELPRYLGNAHRSLTKAASRLGTWHDSLVSYQATARRYETQAVLHAKSLRSAESTHAATTSRADASPSDLHAATTALTEAREALQHVRRLARELEETHRAEAARVAKCLDEATDRLAPEEPGVLSRAIDWISEDLGDVLSDVSAVMGFAGLVLGAAFPPLGLGLMIVATGASMGALGLHLSDDKVRASLRDGFTKGEFDADFWDNAVTLTGDTLGSIPGVAALAEGTKALRASTSLTGSGTLADLGAGAREFADASKSSIDELRHIESPLTEWALREAHPRVRDGVKYGVPATGAVTAASHYSPLDENETVSNSATAVDGTRAAIEDAPTSAARLAHVWASLSG
ncbi:putative T7SS-secreted protein [Streptomyces sp. NPDC093546]|uniref:putative T7SS-secreted protein n=1 Tax=Streptomyces sp. NPDC093546 TaxID=3366040 RepID=UPI00382BE3E8